MEKVFLTKTSTRADAVSRLFAQFDPKDFKDKRVALKANYNSADPFPASTHLDTLSAIIKELKARKTTNIVLAERSGMGETQDVLAQTGVLTLSEQLGFDGVILDELEENEWVKIGPERNHHWQNGFLLAKAFTEADKIVQTCCLKTHRFGGHFTLSLKNSIGMIAEHNPTHTYDYMRELHSSPHQRHMIAEVNTAYKADLIIMDATEAFVKGGPEAGDRVSPGIMLAARDRVAIDAAGVSILRHYGTTKEVSTGKIFEQQQIARAAELGVGVSSASDIQLIPIDSASKEFAEQISKILATG